MSRRKLTKSPTNVVFTGTLAGISEYIGIDPTILRVIFAVGTFMYGTGLILYIILAMVIPSARYRGDGRQRYDRQYYGGGRYQEEEKPRRKEAEKIDEDEWSDF